MNDHLFVFTVGPVQSFIAQARKTQDLFAGSRLLSKLSRVAFEHVRDKHFATPIFPDFSGSSHPNRFIVRVSESVGTTFLEIGKGTEKAVRAFFQQEAMRLILQETDRLERSLRQDEARPALPKNLEAQLANHLEIFWAFYPCSDPAEHFESCKALEKLLGSLKNVRRFQQNHWLEAGRKCSLDGERNALFFKKNLRPDGQGKLPSFLQEGAVEIPSDKILPNEGLSAVSFFKRFYESEGFPSTAGIASMNFTEHYAAADPIWKDNFETFKNTFTKRHWDEQLLYEENLNEAYFRKHELPKRLADQLNLKDEHGKPVGLAAKCKSLSARKKSPRLSSYYAILVFDGDGMGEWVRGKNLKNKTQLLDFQQKLSRLFSQFGGWASTLGLEKPFGKAVYAGGDDFLGFVNLANLFFVLENLRTAFDRQVNREIKTAFSDLDQDLTFSAGIAIAHYKQPLGYVLAQARETEKLAKKLDGKNALAVSLIRHSGSADTCVLPFGKDLTATTQAFLHLVGSLQKGDFSNTFITEFEMEMRSGALDGEEEMQRCELKRLLGRACQAKKLPGETKEQFEARMLQPMLDHAWALRSGDEKNFLAALNVCDFIHRNS